MKSIIIYGSQYGTARAYAEKLSEMTNIQSVSFQDLSDSDGCDLIIYIGGLYAGGVMGMSKTLKRLGNISGKKIIIITVGLADPKSEENVKSIREGIKRQLPPGIYEQAKIFHLRGGIDYSRLSFKHKTMMGLLYRKAKNLPEEKKTAEVRAMIDTYNSKVDFTDFDCLEELISEISRAQYKSKGVI